VKAKSMLIVALLIAIMPITLPAATKSRDGSATNSIGVGVSAQDGTIPQEGTVLSGASTAPTAAPRGPEGIIAEL
jgi:hypothetical protein